MSAHKTSAVVDDNESLDVLFVLHNKFNLMDFAGPWEVFTAALHDSKDPGTFLPAFCPTTFPSKAYVQY
ncbi:hypothetical protein IMZ48_33235 [Candidatus Bathyarchaeota archaeon]|nr:hypothetical protein [Candidatus Bathyarchaeota archaeon]